MLEQLRNYYILRGIAAEAFSCPHAALGPHSCRSNNADFVTAREAFVGSEYEKGTFPRVLFLSIDASTDHPGRAPAERTVEYMRFWEENGRPYPQGCDAEHLHKGRHWYWTHKIAHEILNPISLSRHGELIQFRHVHKYFAHTNSAKCKDAARGSGQGPEQVFRNCRPYIPGEIIILRPDVIITQRSFGRIAIDGAFRITRRLIHPTHPEYAAEVLLLDGREVLKFCIYHQTNYGAFNRERKIAYPWYFEIAQKFLTDVKQQA